MKSLRDLITEESKRVVRAANRPDSRRRDEGVLFHDTGSTGWGRKRDLRGHKKGKSEHNFADQHDRFFDPAVDEEE
jgi:hypothetical protein